MWILLVRAPAPDKAYWLGRRSLAVLDALLWPTLACLALAQVPGTGGVAKPMGVALALLFAACRLDTAWRRNHRYRWRRGDWRASSSCS